MKEVNITGTFWICLWLWIVAMQLDNIADAIEKLALVQETGKHAEQINLSD